MENYINKEQLVLLLEKAFLHIKNKNFLPLLLEIDDNVPFYIKNLSQKNLDSLVASAIKDYIEEVVSIIKETL